MSERDGTDAWHLSLSVHRDLWDHILAGLLPIQLGAGTFHLLRDLRGAVALLGIEDRARLLLEQRPPPRALVRAGERVREAWQGRRDQVHRLVDDAVHVEGEWRFRIESEGSRFVCGRGMVGLTARVGFTAEGQIRLAGGTSRPFTWTRTAGASLDLEDIRYDPARRAVVGTLARPQVDMGELLPLQLAGRFVEFGLDRQLDRVNPLTVLSREQVEGLVSPAGEALKLHMGVDQMILDVDGEQVSLKVRFGFVQRQIQAG